MAGAGLEVRGEKELARKLKKLARQSPEHAAGALRIEAEYTMTRSKRDRVPVDFGVLKASGHVGNVERKVGGWEVVLGFGGPAGAGNQGETNRESVGYALVQHEGLEFAHRVGEAKFLERQMNADVPGMAGRIAKEIARRQEKDAR